MHLPHTLALTLPAILSIAMLPTAYAQSCEAKSGDKPLTVVELYTSEGCSSCPPADQWLGQLKGNPQVLAMSFHVNYWNYLGWKDPYASQATTERQYLLQKAMRASHVYTPQVVLNGNDFRQWRYVSAKNLSSPLAVDAPRLRLQRNGQTITANIEPSAQQQTLAGYWVVLQDGVTSKVLRGENAGETLQHEHVVSAYQPVAAWSANKSHNLQFTMPITQKALAGSKERVAFVVTDSSLSKPVQALVLACS